MESNEPKEWMNCSPEEKECFIEGLSSCYKKNGLSCAKIEVQQQIGVNLIKGQTSFEEMLFSENFFSETLSQNIEIFTNEFQELRDTYDESTAMVAPCACYIQGDTLAKLNALVRISDGEAMESVDTASSVIIAWQSKYQGVSEYLKTINDSIAQLRQESKLPKVYCVNIDKSASTEELKELTKNFSNLEIFGQRNPYLSQKFLICSVNSFENQASLAPFVIVINDAHKISFAKPVCKAQKALKIIQASQSDEAIQEILKNRIKKPFIEMPEDKFEENFSRAFEVISTFGKTHPELVPVLAGFVWKGVIVIKQRQFDAAKTFLKFKSTFMISLQGKSSSLLKVKSALQEAIESVKSDGLYFKFNEKTIPTFETKLLEECCECSASFTDKEQYQQVQDGLKAYCNDCAQAKECPLLIISPSSQLEDFVSFKILTKDPKVKSSSSSKTCDGCAVVMPDHTLKCAQCIDLDFCDACYQKYEKEGCTEKDEEFGVCSGHVRGKHSFWRIPNYKIYTISY